MTKKNYNEKDILIALRQESKNSLPEESFIKKLQENINETKSKESGFSWKNFFYFATPVIAILFVFSFALLTRPKNQSLNSNIEQAKTKDSPVLSALGYDTREENLEQKKLDDTVTKDESSAFSLSGSSGISPSSAYTDFYAADKISSNRLTVNEILSGGKIDDNKDFDEFLSYVEDSGYQDPTYGSFSTRYKITVKDKSGKALIGQKLRIGDNSQHEYLVTTDRDGVIYFYPSQYIYTQDRSNKKALKYSVRAANETFNFEAHETEWNIKLDQQVSDSSNTVKNLDLAFTVDTTGSMSDQINKLKETIDTISSESKKNNQQIKIRYGMVLYRDRGDEYVTRVYDFTDSLEEFQKTLNQVEAGGGGDYPEDVNAGLEDTMEKLSWSSDTTSVRINFLIADAPPHNDYGQQYDYRVATLRAMEMGIKIYPIASSGLDNTEGEYLFRQLALISNGKYIFITGSNGETEYHVSENNYSVDSLDKVIIEAIEEEVAR